MVEFLISRIHVETAPLNKVIVAGTGLMPHSRSLGSLSSLLPKVPCPAGSLFMRTAWQSPSCCYHANECLWVSCSSAACLGQALQGLNQRKPGMHQKPFHLPRTKLSPGEGEHGPRSSSKTRTGLGLEWIFLCSSLGFFLSHID